MAHSLTLSRRDIEHAEFLARKASHGHRDPAPAATGRMGKSLQAAEVIGAAFVSGVVKGKYGPVSLGPVPADALAALILGGFGIFTNGRASAHALNFGIGLGAGYGHAFGAGLGAQWGASGAVGPQQVKVSGALGRGNAPLTEAEIRAMAQAVR